MQLKTSNENISENECSKLDETMKLAAQVYNTANKVRLELKENKRNYQTKQNGNSTPSNPSSQMEENSLQPVVKI